MLTNEKRSPPSEDDYRSLVRQNLFEIGRELESSKAGVQQNKECLKKLSSKLDQVIRHTAEHDKASKELLENFAFQRRLRKWLVGVGAGVTMLITLWLQSEHFFEHIVALFKHK